MRRPRTGRPLGRSATALDRSLWRRGWTQTGVAVRLGVTQGTVSRVLAGTGGSPALRSRVRRLLTT